MKKLTEVEEGRIEESNARAELLANLAPVTAMLDEVTASLEGVRDFGLVGRVCERLAERLEGPRQFVAAVGEYLRASELLAKKAAAELIPKLPTLATEDRPHGR